MFRGIIPPVVTPFDKAGVIDSRALKRVIDYVISNGVHGVFFGGSQGEFFSMTVEERIELYEQATALVAGRVPVFAGTAAITTHETIKLSIAAEKAGCNALSIIGPYFIKPNQEELYRHYMTVADAVSIPILLYNNPDRVGYNLPVALLERLAIAGNIVGMKDSGGDLTYVNDVIRRLPEDFAVFCGRDTVILNVLASGGAGAVPASGNVAPKLIVGLYNAVQCGDFVSARAMQAELALLRNAFALGSFPVVIKEALDLLGMDVGPARLPIQPLQPDKREELRKVLVEMKLL